MFTEYLLFKGAFILGTGLFLITSVTIGLGWFLSYARQNEHMSIFDKPMEIEFSLEEPSHPKLDIAMKYHEKTKHTYAELMMRTGGLDWSRQPSVFKEYPQDKLIKLVINNVEKITRGIYHYDPAEHALELLKEGDYRFRIANACLGQELVGNANVAIIKTAVFERVKPYGNRGYRYVHLDAGAIGENIYLEAISMGLGVCGIGAFFDDQINGMLNIDGDKEALVYVTSVGRI